MRAGSLFVVALALAPLAVLSAADRGPAAVAAPTERTVYVTVTGAKGVPVTDLTAADFTIREGGRDREIVKAEPATARIQVALLVEERLVSDGAVRVALFEFMKRLQGRAEFAFIIVGLRNEMLVDYTTDMNVLVGALNKLSLNPNPSSNLTEGVLELAQSLEKERMERPVIVAVALSGGQVGGPAPNTVLNHLRQSGAGMHAVTLAGGAGSAEGIGTLADSSGREQVLGDGAKQAGGRRHEVNATNGMARALQQVADDLLAQFVITYTLPDGVKPDRRLNVGLKRRGVTLRAPTVMPDR